MATVEEVLAKAAEWEAAGQPDKAAKLRSYAEKMKAPAPDVSSVLAKANEWEKAGNAENAAKLRGYAAKMAQPQVTGPQPPPRADAAHDKANAFAQFEEANPPLKGRYMAGDYPKPGDRIPKNPNMQGRGDYYTVQGIQTARAAAGDTFGDTAAAMVEGPMAAAGAFGKGLTGQGPSPTLDYLGVKDPTIWQRATGAIGDVGGAALSLTGAGLSGVAGMASELVPGQSGNAEKKLAGDVLGMSMFAVPELAGASSIGARMAGATAKVAPVATNVAPVAKVAAPVTDQAIATLLGEAARASGKPSGAGAAKIAAGAAPDMATIAAAKRLGFDLPADVYATNQLIRRAAGGTRGVVGSEAEGHWIGTVIKAVNNASELFGKITSGDVSIISDRVYNQLGALQTTLKSEANRLYDQVEAVVPKNSKVQPLRAVALLEKRAADLGGVSELAPGETVLLNKLKAGPTYEWVKTQKGRLGQSAFGVPDQFPNFDKAFQRRLTGTLSDDLLSAAERVGGPDARDALRLANQLIAKQKGVQERIVAAFGKDGIASIAPKISAAIQTAAKGDATGLNKLLRILPEEIRGDAILAGIQNASKGSGLARNGMGVVDGGGFGFAEFSKLWGNVHNNKKVEGLIQESIGDAPKQMLDDLYKVARALTDARGNVSTTGQSNQWLMMIPKGVIERLAQSNTTQQVIKKGVVGAGAMMNPVAAMAASGLVDAINFGSKGALEAAGRLFRSPEFLNLMKRADATPEVIAANPAVRKWAEGQGIIDVVGWVKSLGNGLGEAKGAVVPFSAQAVNTNENLGSQFRASPQAKAAIARVMMRGAQ